MDIARKRLRCFLIGSDTLLTACGDTLLAGGHEVAGIVSDPGPATDWAGSRGLAVLDPNTDYASHLRTGPFDYLFSISNMRVVPAEALLCPVLGAINFHEAPLPQYAGVNTPIWGLIGGEPSWGITWHFMTTKLDAGEILLTSSFGIAPDETALSLKTKCFAAGLESFAELIGMLSSGTAAKRPQGPMGRYYGKHQRVTAAAAIDWTTPAKEIEAMVRALDCGRYPNPMASPQLFVGNEVLIVQRARVLDGAPSSDPPGTVLATSGDGIDVATGRGGVRLLGFTTQSGLAVAPEEAARRLGLAPGSRLGCLDPLAREQLAALSAPLSKAESFWAGRLAALNPLELQHSVSSGRGQATLPVVVPAPFRNRYGEDLAAALVTAYSIYLGRIGHRNRFDLGLADGKAQGSGARLALFLATERPFTVSFDPTEQFGALLARTATELALVSAKAPYLRDLVARRPELRQRAVLAARDPLPVRVAVDADLAFATETGILTLAVGTGGEAPRLLYELSAFAPEVAAAMAAGLTELLTAVAADPTRPVGEYEFPAGIERVRAFWKDMLRGVGAPASLGLRHPGSAAAGPTPGAEIGSKGFRVSRGDSDGLRGLADQHAITLDDAVKAAWAALLAIRTGEPDVVFGVAEVSQNVLPLRLTCDDDQSLSTLLAALRSRVAGIRSFGDIRQGEVLAFCALPGDSVLYETVVVSGDPPGSLTGAGPRPVAPLVLFVHGATELVLTIQYDRARFDQAAIDCIGDHLVAIVSALAASPGLQVGELPRLSEREKQRLLVEWNDTGIEVASASVHGVIEDQVRRTPDAIAIVHRGTALTYRELNRRANLVAAELRKRGVGPDVMVGIFVERGVEMLVGLLGVLKAGGAYLPMDPQYPADRLTMMLEDSRAPVILTLDRLLKSVPPHHAAVIVLDAEIAGMPHDPEADRNPRNETKPEDLAYVIFTSGSTGRPKGVQIEHRNVINFFAGMDHCLGHEVPGVWLAVTSISFDISVLELLWTLARGFKVVIQEEPDRAPVTSSARSGLQAKGMEFSLFYFAADAGDAPGSKYRLLLEGAKFADRHGFSAIWTPERHFHAFGGLYPNPALTSAAIAVLTERIDIRAGSVVLPLHNPIRAAEDWAVVDNLSGGRVGLSFASGWHAADFALAPGNYPDRRKLMAQGIETVRALWRGESIVAKGGDGQDVRVKIFPQPIQREPRIWVTASSNPETFAMAGKTGSSVLTNLLSMKMEELVANVAVYRAAWKEAGHRGQGHVSLMLHAFVGDDQDEVKRKVRGPFLEYLKSSTDLISKARWEQSMFARPDKRGAPTSPSGTDLADLTAEEMDAMMAHAFERYYKAAGLFGTPDSCLEMVEKLRSVGVDEIACLIDFGVDTASVLEGLSHLNELRQRCLPVDLAGSEDYSVPGQIRRHRVTHLQCTPSMARILASEGDALESLRPLKKLLLGGEALPDGLAGELGKVVSGEILNMYGPTETTVWSTTSKVSKGTDGRITIGRPIANTQIYIVDQLLRPRPIGAPGEILIGGAGVVRGYLGRPDLTSEKFIPNPFGADPSARLYRTGDLGRWLPDGSIDYAGRVDQQVKIRGYRIELGEIESVIGKHPRVRACAVVAREDTPGDKRIVGYVVPRGAGAESPTIGAGPSEVTADWQKIWDETYRLAHGADRDDLAAEAVDPTFDIAGWNSSFDGAPIPSAEMREWVDRTTERILALEPKRVLEIGCGTGMFLFRVAPHCAHYCGVDFSPAALKQIAEQLGPLQLPQVSLRQRPADDFSGLELGSFDTVVISSVIQYFPSVDYLVDIIGKALAVLAPGGKLFIGDVRSLPLLEPFYAAVELWQAADSTSTSELNQRIKRRATQERELAIDPAFFEALPTAFADVGAVAINLKRGRSSNELTRFRYDVVIVKGLPARSLDRREPDYDAAASPTFSAGAVGPMLQGAPATFVVANVLNRHVAREHLAIGLLGAGAAGVPNTVGELRAALARLGDAGCQPEDFEDLVPDYRVEVAWAASGAVNCFDVVFRHRSNRAPAVSRGGPVGERKPWQQYANHPNKGAAEGNLLPLLRAYLKDKLPAFMVPTAIMTLDALPLTPNGKIDRKALPEPDRFRQESAAGYQAPTHDLERVIAGVWQELLGLSQVSTVDNLFDLGANSLLMVQANGRLRTTLGGELSLVDMFQYPTVKSLATFLALRRDGEAAQVDTSLQVSQGRGQSRREALQRLREQRPGVAKK